MPVSPKAQEPSIDEILDSIRRIIADEDLAVDVADEVSSAYAPPATAQPRPHVRPEVQAVRRNLDSSPTVARSGHQYAGSTERGGRYAPVLPAQSDPVIAEPRYRSVDQTSPAVRVVNPPVREPEPRRQSVMVQKPAREASRQDGYLPEPQSLAEEARVSGAGQANSALPTHGDDRMSNNVPPFSGQNAGVRSRVAAPSKIDQPQGSEGRVPLPRRDLLSPAVDAAVSAAFQSLGDLVLPQHERTVEDLVKEILRPMLKEWLDQNLAGIVERLVRAEIERVTGNIR